MRTLLLLRHAKAAAEGADGDDHSRPLTDEGRDDAARVGDWLAEHLLVPDAIISSTAVRAEITARQAASRLPGAGPIYPRRDLYLAEPSAYLEILRGWPDDEACVMMVGHNDGIEQLLSRLCGEPQHMKTATLAHLRFPWKSWSEAELTATGRLVDLWRP